MVRLGLSIDCAFHCGRKHGLRGFLSHVQIGKEDPYTRLLYIRTSIFALSLKNKLFFSEPRVSVLSMFLIFWQISGRTLL